MLFFRRLQRSAFWLWSHTAAFLYGCFPIFGRLQGVMVILEREGRFLVIERNDGLGFGFPGGFLSRNEESMDGLRRELREETGLTLLNCRELCRYESEFRFPTRTIVYVGEADGKIRPSWEGQPKWLTLPEIEAKIYPGVRPMLPYLRNRNLPGAPPRSQDSLS